MNNKHKDFDKAHTTPVEGTSPVAGISNGAFFGKPTMRHTSIAVMCSQIKASAATAGCHSFLSHARHENADREHKHEDNNPGLWLSFLAHLEECI